MLQFTKGFTVEDTLARYVEKLEEVMTILITVYDHIQNYQDQHNLITFIADISSAGAKSINVNDLKLNEAILQLNIVIKSNLVIKQYKRAMDAFKQWVFPFAHHYLKELMLLSDFKLHNNTQNLVHEAEAQIGHTKSKVKEYKVSIAKQDKYIVSGEFISHYVSTKPFFFCGKMKDTKL